MGHSLACKKHHTNKASLELVSENQTEQCKPKSERVHAAGKSHSMYVLSIHTKQKCKGLSETTATEEHQNQVSEENVLEQLQSE